MPNEGGNLKENWVMQNNLTRSRYACRHPPLRGGPILKMPLVPLLQPPNAGFNVSYHIQDTFPYENVSTKTYTSCIACGRSADAIKKQKADEYIRSTPRDESTYVTKLRKEAFLNGHNVESFFFIPSAVSQAAAYDGSTITTTANGQDIATGTLPLF